MKGESISALKRQIQMTMALGILSILAGIFAHLALTDIHHGEDNLALEWNALRGSAAVFFLFVVASLATLRRALKNMR
jgi:hypothetical protein